MHWLPEGLLDLDAWPCCQLKHIAKPIVLGPVFCMLEVDICVL